jgi:hypothetical protein
MSWKEQLDKANAAIKDAAESDKARDLATKAKSAAPWPAKPRTALSARRTSSWRQTGILHRCRCVFSTSS